MRTLSIDLETYSEVELKGAGLYKYAENSEILLFAYAFDTEPVRVIDLASGEEVPEEVLDALQSPDVTKTAFNAAFEMQVLNRWGRAGIMNPAQWQDTMVLCYTLGLPGNLDGAGKVLGLSEDKKKLATGKRLIQYFSKPCKPTKANGGRTRNYPKDALDKWEEYIEYNRQDVETERTLRTLLLPYAETFLQEQTLWQLDQKINNAGVLVDRELTEQAIKLDEQIKARTLEKLISLTGIANPNSNPQLLTWFTEQEGWTPNSLDKATRAELLASDNVTETTKEVLRLKQLIAKTSVKKYEAIRKARCGEGRVHGMLQFYGASRTGRWAGRLVQLQNLPQNHLHDLDVVREFVRKGDLTALDIFYRSPSDVLSQLIRTAFIAPEGQTFLVADFSAIEARVIAWLADETWRQEAFARGEDIYCASASQMFGVPVVKHGVNGDLRQKGKVAELACGYGGGVNALKAFGADKMGLSEDDMQSIVKQWREASPSVCKLWYDVETAAKKAIRLKGAVVQYKKGIDFQLVKRWLFVRLPNGRKLSYYRPRVEVEEEFGKESITYEGGIQGAGAWGRLYTWGGKLVENLVQALARDCLAETMINLEKEGFKIVMHIHDEVVIESDKKEDLDKVIEVMSRPIPWAEGLLLKGDGYTTDYYKKD